MQFSAFRRRSTHFGTFGLRLKTQKSAEQRRKAPVGAEGAEKRRKELFGGNQMPKTVVDVRSWAIGDARHRSDSSP
eukprot:10359167-Alexandrium_andersonii.AAC.1